MPKRENIDFEEDKTEGRFEALLALISNLPEMAINDRVERFLNMPYTKATKEIEKLAKKKEKTLRDMMVISKISDLLKYNIKENIKGEQNGNKK